MPEKNEPEVTIILPAYNGGKWISRAIKSALSQTFDDFEFIIINDGSSDDTEAIVLRSAGNDPRIRFLKNERNLGVQKTRNVALGMARGEYIAEIDQDDEWLDEDKLLKQVDFLKKNPELALCGTGAVIVDEEGKEIARYLMPQTDSEIRKKILRMNCFIHSSALYKADAVKQIGGYTVEKMSEDHDLWLRLGRTGKFANLPSFSVQYRFSPGGYNSQDKFIRLKQNLLFAKEHRNFYPGYFLARATGLAKIILYPLFKIMPNGVKGIMLKLHKKI